MSIGGQTTGKEDLLHFPTSKTNTLGTGLCIKQLLPRDLAKCFLDMVARGEITILSLGDSDKPVTAL